VEHEIYEQKISPYIWYAKKIEDMKDNYRYSAPSRISAILSVL